jgi:hypothetical protein
MVLEICETCLRLLLEGLGLSDMTRARVAFELDRNAGGRGVHVHLGAFQVSELVEVIRFAGRGYPWGGRR